MFKKANPVADVITGKQRQRTRFKRSLQETAAHAVVTATVSFAVGWILKKMLEGSVAEAAKEGAQEGAEDASQSDTPKATFAEFEETPPAVPAQ